MSFEAPFGPLGWLAERLLVPGICVAFWSTAALCSNAWPNSPLTEINPADASPCKDA